MSQVYLSKEVVLSILSKETLNTLKTGLGPYSWLDMLLKSKKISDYTENKAVIFINSALGHFLTSHGPKSSKILFEEYYFNSFMIRHMAGVDDTVKGLASKLMFIDIVKYLKTNNLPFNNFTFFMEGNIPYVKPVHLEREKELA